MTWGWYCPKCVSCFYLRIRSLCTTISFSHFLSTLIFLRLSLYRPFWCWPVVPFHLWAPKPAGKHTSGSSSPAVLVAGMAQASPLLTWKDSPYKLTSRSRRTLITAAINLPLHLQLKPKVAEQYNRWACFPIIIVYALLQTQRIIKSLAFCR
jgi:hypothetical protein